MSRSNDDPAMAVEIDEDKPEQPAPRKASDIIIGLEGKFDMLVMLAKNNDANTKHLLGRMNKVCSLLENVVEQLKLVNGIAPEPVPEAVSEQPEIKVEKTPIGQRRTARPETYTEEKSAKVIPVEQKVFDNTGKAVFMAEVEILNWVDRSFVAKLRTTAAGKWQVPLQPGEYIVTITKRENGTRKKLFYTKEFSVTESSEPIKLESASLTLEV